MTLLELDKKLKELNGFEKELMSLGQSDVKLLFSKASSNDFWKINSEKLMLRDEEIAIHKHDRFIEFSSHNHDYLEMMFVYSGESRHIINGEEIVLIKGDILLMDMDTSHSIKAALSDDIAINILMKREFFNTFFMNQIAYNDKLTSFVVDAIYGTETVNRHLCFNSNGNKKIWDLIINVLLEYYEKKNGSETAIRAYILLLFNELIRNYHKYLDNHVIEKVGESVLIEIASYIDENYKTLTLKNMAKVFNYNPDYLGKQIKKMTGVTLKNLVKKRKIKEAAKLLRNTKLSILDILKIIHYSNVSYFYKQFRIEYNMTPDEYRNA